MKFVYIDESGYTGHDLLNSDQTFQGASAIYISEDDAVRIIKEYFPKLKASELKYRDLVRRKNNWDRLLGLQKELLENFDCVTYVCDKKYVLILLFIDYAVEPFYYDRGIDFYKDGCNYSLASLVYYVAGRMLGDNNFSEVLSLFQYAVKSKSDLSISALIEKVKRINWQELPECFGPLALEDSSCIRAIKCEDVSSDAAFIVLFSLISRLEVIIDSEYMIKHDKSKNLDQYDVVLRKMINHTNKISFKETSLTAIKFPLKLKSVEQVDSKLSYGVQLSDILVGGIMDSAKAITGKKINQYNKKISELYCENQLIHLLPNLDFKMQKEFRHNTESEKLIDYFSKHFS
ncbi:MAG: DUF3800 domain-containing protein [Desulfobacteraceae bacterium]|nr:DUF3800 domain-containing protein [Desulfobacteraceae bacterium]